MSLPTHERKEGAIKHQGKSLDMRTVGVSVDIRGACIRFLHTCTMPEQSRNDPVQPVSLAEEEKFLFPGVAVGAYGFTESKTHHDEFSTAFYACEIALQP